MKSRLNILIFLTSFFCFSQMKVDTSKVDFIRYEFKIVNTKDTILNESLTKFSSGIYKQEFLDMKGNYKYGFVNIFELKTKNGNLDFLPYRITHYWSLGDGFQHNYYDSHNVLDSVYLVNHIDSLKQIKYNLKKEYLVDERVDWLSNVYGNREQYKYMDSINSYQIKVFKNSKLYEIKTYQNNLLTSQKFPQRKKYRKEFLYKYDAKGRIILIDDNDYFLLKYYYDSHGLKNIEKIFKKKDEVIETTSFGYDIFGRVIEKNIVNRNNRLIDQFIYTYK